MNRKWLLLGGVAAVLVAIISLGVWWYFSTHQQVLFTIKAPGIKVELRDSSDKTVSTLSQNSTLTMANGEYTANPSGGDIDTSPIRFIVSNNTTEVVIDPPNSDAFLTLHLDDELEDIKASLIDAYPNIINRYTIGRGELLRDGTWYITTLRDKGDTNNSPKDIYRAILHKENGIWRVSGTPAIIPTKQTNPDAPADVRRSAFELSVEFNN